MPDLPDFQPLFQTRVLAQRGGVRSEAGEWGGQAVFVKTLLSDDPAAAQRFEHEGEIAAALDHPGVVPLLARRPAQLIFPWLEGQTLRERVEAGPLSAAEALEVADGLLAAVAHLHARGVTHHDLKPENVLLEGGQARSGSVRLIDFGMSHSRALALDIHGGTRMGTPHFMAPEQFRGVRGDPRSDLYSVGVLLFDCLAGHPPYADALGWLTGLTDERAPLPGPPELHGVLCAALSRDPAGRPASAQALRSALREAARALGLELERACP
ncbi:serine/threonine-protein kinase [Deinococcus budaensis]|uniref:Serine/threonine-protein kinase n=1 Tax=Deinococcus budaensis TaxID=1665626 RepID=A0A7W8GBV4_9DEIO|nr:serine/threonine-protein kinase [Deinococcus budaensis]